MAPAFGMGMDDTRDVELVPVEAVPAPTPLPPSSLRNSCDPESFHFASTADLPVEDVMPGQERALEALQLGLEIRKDGFNVFVLGPTGGGKKAAVLDRARRRASSEPAPSAWCYVHNFEDARRPRALRLPAGRARPFAKAMQQLVDDLRTAIPAALESERYLSRKQQIEAAHKERGEQALADIRKRAAERSVAVVHTPSGMTIAPVAEGEIMMPDAFAELEEGKRKQLLEDMEVVRGWLRDLSAELPAWVKAMREELRALDHEVTIETVAFLMSPIRAAHADLPGVLAYLDAVQADVRENAAEIFAARPDGASGIPALQAFLVEAPVRRFRVNVLVDPDPAGGAPVITDESATFASLFGHHEYRSELGSATTDFTMIEAGSLHRANGGYVVLDARRVLGNPAVWEELKRRLRERQLGIELLVHRLGLASTTTLEPEPIPLDVKVILLGERLLYYLLAQYDPEFLELFKVAADFEDSMARTAEGEQSYARLLAGLARARSARPLDPGAVALAVEQASRAADDGLRLSLHLQGTADLIDEADHHAGQAGRKVITAADVREAVAARIRRNARVRDRMLDAQRRGVFLVDTSGVRIGQVNGLAVVQLGDLVFGHPTRITARARMGAGEVIDVEREVDLGGPIHSKGVLILSSFLGARYSAERPLSLAASLVFEQSYGPVEGDSASAAELAALLSALAEVPIKQALGVTGSVDQNGMVQAVGGVTHKVEGFFDACRVNGGPVAGQGVILPASNATHLMLRDDVIEAVEAGRFAVYTVETIDEVIALLTGLPPGVREASGGFPLGSVNGRVERRLAAFADQATRPSSFVARSRGR